MLDGLADSITVLDEEPKPPNLHVTRISPVFQIGLAIEHPMEIAYPVSPDVFPEAFPEASPEHGIELQLYRLIERKSRYLSLNWLTPGDGTLQGARTDPTYVHLVDGLGGTYFFGYEPTGPRRAHDPSALPPGGPQAPVRIRMDPPDGPIVVNPQARLPEVTVTLTRADGTAARILPTDSSLSFKTRIMSMLEILDNTQLAWEDGPRLFYQDTLTASYQGLTVSKTIVEKLPLDPLPGIAAGCLYAPEDGGEPIRANRIVLDGGDTPVWTSTYPGRMELREYGRRSEEPRTVMIFDCESPEDFHQAHRALRHNPGVRYQEPYLPTQDEARIVELETWHGTDNLTRRIPLKIRVKHQDGLARDLGQEDLPDLEMVSSDPSVIRVNPQGEAVAVGIGRADLTIAFGGVTEVVRAVPVPPIAIDGQCRIWSHELAGLTIPEHHAAGYANANPTFTAEPPIPPEVLTELAQRAGWRRISHLGGNAYRANLGLDCLEDPRRTAGELMDALGNTWDLARELLPGTNMEFDWGKSVTTGDMNARPSLSRWQGSPETFPQQRGIYVHNQDDLVEFEPIQAWPSRLDPETGWHYHPPGDSGLEPTLTTQTTGTDIMPLDGSLGFPITPGAIRFITEDSELSARQDVRVHAQPRIQVDDEPRCSGDILGAGYAVDQLAIRLKDSVRDPDDFIWALAGSRRIQGDVVGRAEGRWYVIRTPARRATHSRYSMRPSSSSRSPTSTSGTRRPGRCPEDQSAIRTKSKGRLQPQEETP